MTLIGKKQCRYAYESQPWPMKRTTHLIKGK